MSPELYGFLMFVKVLLICAIAMLLVSFIPDDMSVETNENDEKEILRQKLLKEREDSERLK